MRRTFTQTEKNWCNFLDECAMLKKFHFATLRAKYKIGSRILQNLEVAGYANYIEKGSYLWTGPFVLTNSEKKAFCRIYRNEITKKNKAYIEKKTKIKMEPLNEPQLFADPKIISIDSQEAINAIQLLKSLGFRILKPINKFEEI